MNIPLSLVKSGNKVKIMELNGGINFIRRINELGLRINEDFEVVSNAGQGQIILRKDSLKIGLGVGMAAKIFVQVVK